MHEAYILIFVLGAHGLLCLFAVVFSDYSGRRLRTAQCAWMLLIPIFGPVTAWVLISTYGKVPSQKERIHRSEKTQENILRPMAVRDMVPLEEALLINDTHKRRLLMMDILRSDPLLNVDLLLIARFNEDTETAHYATATIMELRRHFQMEIQRRQAELRSDESDFVKKAEYAKFLFTYCESGLLEGQVLRRQRLVLKKALEECMQQKEDQMLLRIMVHNSLALKEAAEAKMAAQFLMNRWPLDENSWIDGMRNCVETHDQNCKLELLEKLDKIPVDFTAKGRKQLLYWMEERT